MNKILILLAGWMLFAATTAFSQTTVPNDEKGKELLSSGKKALKAGSYSDAANKFELVLQRPFSRFYTSALYYAGLSYYYQKDNQKALARFVELTTRFPESRYVDDVHYHEALMLLEAGNNNDRGDGLTRIYKVYGTTTDAALRRDALATMRHFCFNVFNQNFIRQNMIFFEDEDKWILQEAILYQHDKANDGWGVKQELKNIEDAKGKLSPYMEALKAKYDVAKGTSNPGELRIAVVLAFNLNQADTSLGVPKASRRALEMYEGMLLALDSLDERTGKQVVVKVFDNRGDTIGTRRIMDGLQEFHPDVVLTEGSTSPAQILGDWCEKHGTVLFVPKNPLEEICQKKQYVFLVHPSLTTHGRVTAEHAIRNEHCTSLGAFNDRTLMAGRFAAGWKAACDSAHIRNSEEVIPKNFREVPGPLASKISELKAASACAVYIPIVSEETSGLILSNMYRSGMKAGTIAYGHPDWEQFNAIDVELKTDMSLTYSTFYFDAQDSVAYEDFKLTCIMEYNCLPTQSMVIGFDMMAYLLTVARDVQPYLPLDEAIRKAPLYKGLHQEFYYNGKQDNQRPTLLRYANGTLTKVN